MTIKDTLEKWLQDPSVLEDAGLTAPTMKSLRIAIVLSNIIDPIWVVPTGDGGIVFKNNGYYLKIESCGSLVTGDGGTLLDK